MFKLSKRVVAYRAYSKGDLQRLQKIVPLYEEQEQAVEGTAKEVFKIEGLWDQVLNKLQEASGEINSRNPLPDFSVIVCQDTIDGYDQDTNQIYISTDRSNPYTFLVDEFVKAVKTV